MRNAEPSVKIVRRAGARRPGACLDCEVGAGGGVGVVHVRLLPGGDAPVDLLEDPLVEHLEEHLGCPGCPGGGRFGGRHGFGGGGGGSARWVGGRPGPALLLRLRWERAGARAARQAGARVEGLLHGGAVLLLGDANGGRLAAAGGLADAVGHGRREVGAVAEVEAVLLRGRRVGVRGGAVRARPRGESQPREQCRECSWRSTGALGAGGGAPWTR